jgi:hypothetical protein
MSPAYLTVTPNYEPGARFRLEVESVRERTGDDRHRLTHVELRVLEATADRTLLAWRPQWTEVLTGEDEQVEMDPELAREIAGLWFEVALDGDGLFLGISNDVVIKETLGRFCEAVIGGARWPSQRQREAARRIFTPEFIFQRAQREIVLYFGLTGKRFPTHEPLRQRMVLPNVLGGENHFADYVVEAKDGPGADEATVLCEQNAELRPLLARVFELGAQPVPDEIDMGAARLIDLTEFVVDKTNGWARTVRFTRRSNLPQFGIFDFMEVRLVGEPRGAP